MTSSEDYFKDLWLSEQQRAEQAETLLGLILAHLQPLREVPGELVSEVLAQVDVVALEAEYATQREKARDIRQRYVEWLRNTPERQSIENPALLPDALAHDALDAMHALSHAMPALESILTAYIKVEREFARGHRCSVCANADDPNYDHGSQC